MSFTIHTAALTQKAKAASYNGDSLNMNGRVLSVESADAGFRGAGKMSCPFVLALAASAGNGFASAALTALNDRMPNLKANCDNFPTILADYFADSSYALEKSGNAPDSLAVSLLFGYENNLIAARMGNVRIYRWSADTLMEVGFVPEEEDEPMPESSCELIEDINDGDVYVLCTEGVWGHMSEAEIIEKLRAAGNDEKQIVRQLASAAMQKINDKSISVFVVRVVADKVAAVEADDSDMRIVDAAPAAAPKVSAFVEAQPSKSAVVAEESNFYVPESEENVYDSEEEEYEDEEEVAAPSKAKKALTIILMIVGLLAGMAAVTFGAYKIAYSRQHSDDVPAALVGVGSQAQYDINVEATTVAPTEAATTDAAATEEATTEEATTEEATTEEEDTEDYYNYYEEYYQTTEAPTEAPTTEPAYEYPEEDESEEESYSYPSYEYPEENESEEESEWYEEEPEPVLPDNPEGEPSQEGYPEE